MGGRGSTSMSADSSGPFKNEGSVELSNERHGSSGYRWRHTILKADKTGDGGIVLSYARPNGYSNPNRNTTEASYSIEHGVWSGQPGDRQPNSIGIDWGKVQYVSGKTYEVNDFIRDKGFRWSGKDRRFVRS